jgi:hypothetical protein
MFTKYFILFVGVLCLFVLSMYAYRLTQHVRESFESNPTINVGPDPQINGKPYDYFY